MDERDDSEEARRERAHDASYRKLFSHPHILATLLRDFVGAEITGALELERMERLETTFISEALLRRQADMLWKIPRAGEEEAPLYLYVLMEFQSRIDALMPIRMLVYVGLIYEHLGKHDASILRSGGLPPILPIVLYNGGPPWSAQTSVREMIGLTQDAALSRFQPELKLYLIDEGRLDQEALAAHNTILAGLLQIEKITNPERIREQVARLGQIVRTSALSAITTDVLMWLNELLQSRGLILDTQQISSFQEADTMLNDTLEYWQNKIRTEAAAEALKQGMVQGIEQGIGQGIEQGIEQGRLAAKRGMLLRQLTLKFGEAEGRAARVDALAEAALDRAFELILSADDEEAILATAPLVDSSNP
jgi:predicted transposase YdaD